MKCRQFYTVPTLSGMDWSLDFITNSRYNGPTLDLRVLSNDWDVAAMLDELTIEANEESFLVVLQHGGNDVTWKRSILMQIISPVVAVTFIVNMEM